MFFAGRGTDAEVGQYSLAHRRTRTPSLSYAPTTIWDCMRPSHARGRAASCSAVPNGAANGAGGLPRPVLAAAGPRCCPRSECSSSACAPCTAPPSLTRRDNARVSECARFAAASGSRARRALGARRCQAQMRARLPASALVGRRVCAAARATRDARAASWVCTHAAAPAALLLGWLARARPALPRAAALWRNRVGGDAVRRRRASGGGAQHLRVATLPWVRRAASAAGCSECLMHACAFRRRAGVHPQRILAGSSARDGGSAPQVSQWPPDVEGVLPALDVWRQPATLRWLLARGGMCGMAAREYVLRVRGRGHCVTCACCGGHVTRDAGEFVTMTRCMPRPHASRCCRIVDPLRAPLFFGAWCDARTALRCARVSAKPR